jgi:hypothetical protein
MNLQLPPEHDYTTCTYSQALLSCTHMGSRKLVQGENHDQSNRCSRRNKRSTSEEKHHVWQGDAMEV